MRITFRLIAALIVAVTAVASFFSYLQVRQERSRLSDELERRSILLAESLQESVEPLLAGGASPALRRLVVKFGKRERMLGVAVYDAKGDGLALSDALAGLVPAAPAAVRDALERGVAAGGLDTLGGHRLHVYALPLGPPDARTGALALFHDAAYIPRRLSQIWRNNFLRLLIQLVMISLVTLAFLRWSFYGPVTRLAEWMKDLRAGGAADFPRLPKEDVFAPLAREAASFARRLSQAQSAAEEEARLRQIAESHWTAEKLKDFVRNKLQGKPLVVVSNREPYMHVRKGRDVGCIIPAGGLVTALDPVLKAAGGLWIAHGSGDADAETADEKGRLRVPPEDPQYMLRRVWLTKEEEDGYYYGFSNEGLWPLCHVAHARPTFREEDWARYKAVNEKFAQAVLEEIAGLEEPCVLVQDYHFALLPRLIKNRRPDARVALFWHIPWTNPESFSICPWGQEILHGMLGADVLGFHIQFHCSNFLDTVDQTLECRIDAEHAAVHRGDHTTLVRRFPISVDFSAGDAAPAGPDRAALLKNLGVKAELLGVGVDRVDYTKGLVERFRAVERFLDKYPQYQGRFTFVELGAPSRTHIKRYAEFLAEVEQEAERINWKFKGRNWRPIVFSKKHHSPEEIRPFYRQADVCLVTSLHDGMNLVAKEFVAERRDEGGALILSRFAGASRELRDALIVNPYDVGQMADAIRFALEMEPAERADRMRRLRAQVRENNVYRWAGSLVTELAGVSLRKSPPAEAGA